MKLGKFLPIQFHTLWLWTSYQKFPYSQKERKVIKFVFFLFNYVHILYITPSYNFKEIVELVMGAEMARINNEKKKHQKNIYTPKQH